MKSVPVEPNLQSIYINMFPKVELVEETKGGRKEENTCIGIRHNEMH
jgi:hypothetical protein